MFTRSRRFKQKFRGRIRGRGNAGAHKLNPIVKETRARKIADPLPLDATMPLFYEHNPPRSQPFS